MDYKDLKIQFRAVPYSKSNHILEYRVYPEQDLRYYKEHKWFWGLIKFGTVAKYSTKWIQPEHYWNHCTAMYYTEDSWDNWGPYFIKNQEELDWYKNNFKTIGEFLKCHNDYSNEEYEAWKIARANYLKEQETMY